MSALNHALDDQLASMTAIYGNVAEPVEATFQERADILLARGIPVIPLLPHSKNPCTKHAALDASSDPTQIAKWAKRYPEGNCGAVARFDGFWILDDDLGTLAQTYKAETGHDLPATLTIKTSRGYHYYFLHDEASRLVRYDGHENSGHITILGYEGEARCQNQYVVGPMSIHPSGSIYEVCDDAPIVSAPVQLLDWLQKAYTQSESLKPESNKPKGGNGNFDPGFRKLFDAVGYRPLGERIKALNNPSLRSVLEDGVCVPCPIPHHKHVDYSNCFGPIAGSPYMLHCLGNCDWSGDMVAACYQVGGGKKKYRTMYDCARAICKEEDLKFEDFFPPKPTASPAEVSEPVVSEIHEIQIPDMPESVLVGRLGEVYDRYMRDDFPVGWSWLSLVTVAGALVPTPEYIRVNLYSGLVGDKHEGKSTCIGNAIKILGLDEPVLQKVMAGSAEGLLHRLRNAGGQSRLLFPDELGHMLSKSKIDNASFPFVLNRAYYDSRFSIVAARGKEIEFNCALSFIGGIVDNMFDSLFGAETVGGLYDRCAFAQCPSGFEYDFRPCLFSNVLKTEPVLVSVDPDVWDAKRVWVRELKLNPRVVEMGLRVAAICASIDGRTRLQVDDLTPILPFVQYQEAVRKTLKPNAGENTDGKLAGKFLGYISRYGVNGEWLEVRAMLRRTRAYDLGVGYQRVLDALEHGGEIEQHGRGVRGQMHVVRSLFRQVTEC